MSRTAQDRTRPAAIPGCRWSRWGRGRAASWACCLAARRLLSRRARQRPAATWSSPESARRSQILERADAFDDGADLSALQRGQRRCEIVKRRVAQAELIPSGNCAKPRSRKRTLSQQDESRVYRRADCLSLWLGLPACAERRRKASALAMTTAGLFGAMGGRQL